MTALMATVVPEHDIQVFSLRALGAQRKSRCLADTPDIVLTVITLWSARSNPWRLVWLGPLAAVAFLLKGTAVLLPVLIAVSVLVLWRVPRRSLVPLLPAVCAVRVADRPACGRSRTRWRFDRWRFFDGDLFNYDFVARMSRLRSKEHEHGWLSHT